MKYYLYISILFLCIGCQSDKLDIDDYFKYLVEPSNGLYQLKRVNQFEIRARYLPLEYLIYRDTKNEKQTPENIDSLKKSYKGSFTFLLQIAPNKADGHDFDVMTQTISSEAAFKQQAFQLNFEMQEHLSLKVNDKEYKPVLVELENTYELTQHRNFMVTYALDDHVLDKPYEQLDFVFEDQIFGTGIHHFLFKEAAIKKTPKLKL